MSAVRHWRALFLCSDESGRCVWARPLHCGP